MLVLLAAVESATDREKLEHLYLTYRQIMFRTANCILRDEALAEDAVQQAFLRIMDHLHKISSVECPQTKSFVVIIVKNIAINYYNSRKKKASSSLDELEDWTADTGFTPAEAAESNDGYERLVRMIHTLPENYQSVLMLRYDNGYSTAEIARMLGLTEENVKKRLQRAKKKLEEELGRVAVS